MGTSVTTVPAPLVSMAKPDSASLDYEQAEDSLASSNLVHVVGHLYGCRVLEAATVYSLLDHLKDRFSEQDVALIFALLNSVGLQLRSDDPAAMKVSFLDEAWLYSAWSEK